MSSLQSLVDSYGYVAIFVGAILEGETLLAMGGFAAQRGYLDLPSVVAVGLVGGFLGDQAFFFLGRRHGQRILARFPALARRAAKVDDWLDHHVAPLTIGIRFMYGFRIVGPIVLGMSRVSSAKFAICNLFGAGIWTVTVAGVGFLFGQGLELMLADAKRYELAALGAIAMVGVALWARHLVRR
jgi:membrane protein DedA with SNARE-associated domain